MHNYDPDFFDDSYDYGGYNRFDRDGGMDRGRRGGGPRGGGRGGGPRDFRRGGNHFYFDKSVTAILIENLHFLILNCMDRKINQNSFFLQTFERAKFIRN